MARREFGAIKTKKDSKRFYATYVGPDLKSHTPGGSFPTKGAAEGWLAAERRLIDREDWTPPLQRRQKAKTAGITVGEWMEKFYEESKYTGKLKETTRHKYQEQMRYRITGDHLNGTPTGVLKNIALSDLSRADILSWWSAVERQFPQTPQQNFKGWTRLSQALAQALHWELIAINPATGVRISTPVAEDKYLPTDDEIFALIDEVPERYKMAAILGLAHGLRIGEVLGLERRHILIERITGEPLPRITIQVRQDAEYTPDPVTKRMRHLFGTTKTRAGVRDVPVLKRFVPDILRHLNTYAAETPIKIVTEEGPRQAILVNVSSRGRLVAPTQLQEDIRQARKALGITNRISMHSGRNWLISKLLQQGVPPHEVGRIMGQEDLATIFHYAKMHAERPREHMDRLNDLL